VPERPESTYIKHSFAGFHVSAVNGLNGVPNPMVSKVAQGPCFRTIDFSLHIDGRSARLSVGTHQKVSWGTRNNFTLTPNDSSSYV